MTGRASPCVTWMVVCLIVFGAEAGSDPPRAEVAPGSVIRWLGAGLEECGHFDDRWQPLGDACWFAIDLLADPGLHTIFRWRDGRREEATLRIMTYPYEVQRITLEDDSKVSLSAEDLRRVEREQVRISALWTRKSPRRFELPLHPPLETLPAGGRFGVRRFFNEQPRSPHSGADYTAQEGTSVLAAADGVVALTGDFFFSGRSVFLDHGDSLITMYFHLSEILVEEGEPVANGVAIGRVGQTGRTTGPHLHFGVRWRRARVDPALLLAPIDRTPLVP